MLNFLGIILGILISSLWIFLPLRRVPQDIRLKKSTYVISIVVGATLCTALIIILESLWDIFSGIPENNPSTVLQAAAYSFTRAALLEEGAKYLFVRHAIKKHQPQGLLQYMLLAGTIGMGYGITEKLVSGSAVSMLFDAAFANHIMFQFVMGWFLYKAATTEDASQKKALSIKAFAVPFLLHGIWDFILFGGSLFIQNDLTAAGVAAVILMLVSVVAAIVCEVCMALYLKKQ